MRIFYITKEKKTGKALKKQMNRHLECLLLVFVVCVFGILLSVQNMPKASESNEPYKQVSNNFVFDLIELEFKKEEDIPIERVEVDFWEIFEQKQMENNG